ncbi:MAG: alkane 1-monooxygenase [Myxococcota bacterium]|nr:alkane 1-monooxygenase [Myxococcota bacterium]
MPMLAYTSVYLIPALFMVGLVGRGLWTWAVALVIYAIIPLVEHFLPGSTSNVDASGQAARRGDPVGRFVTYSLFPIQVACSVGFLAVFDMLKPVEAVGLTVGLGTIQGALGINGAHELGHQRTRYSKRIAKSMLIWSIYPHFLAEHNRGHHTRVATADDPATAPRNQTVYTFWFQSLIGGVISAWTLESARLQRKRRGSWSLQNEVLRGCVMATAGLALITVVFGIAAACAFLCASLFGVLLLETVNYLQHYGLTRARAADGTYERVGPQHTWTSNHVLSRVLLLDLPRHADHHLHAGRYYANLKHHERSPLLPTGYPGLIILALIPPLFLLVMNRSLDRFQDRVIAND